MTVVTVDRVDAVDRVVAVDGIDAVDRVVTVDRGISLRTDIAHEKKLRVYPGFAF